MNATYWRFTLYLQNPRRGIGWLKICQGLPLSGSIIWNPKEANSGILCFL
uniref:Uncharacterized protein n=1 Tax=Picea glauca TaxID=3330 RepID=A0A101M1D3_PICGL|nr:hypothetical protein ABT39_MTgene3759 [Picea glauca]